MPEATEEGRSSTRCAIPRPPPQAWRHHNRLTVSPERIEKMTGGEAPGLLIGFRHEAEFETVFHKPFAARP